MRRAILLTSCVCIGVIGQLHFYPEDLFPKIFGLPLFGGGS